MNDEQKFELVDWRDEDKKNNNDQHKSANSDDWRFELIDSRDKNEENNNDQLIKICFVTYFVTLFESYFVALFES